MSNKTIVSMDCARHSGELAAPEKLTFSDLLFSTAISLGFVGPMSLAVMLLGLHGEARKGTASDVVAMVILGMATAASWGFLASAWSRQRTAVKGSQRT